MAELIVTALNPFNPDEGNVTLSHIEAAQHWQRAFMDLHSKYADLRSMALGIAMRTDVTGEVQDLIRLTLFPRGVQHDFPEDPDPGDVHTG